MSTGRCLSDYLLKVPRPKAGRSRYSSGAGSISDQKQTQRSIDVLYYVCTPCYADNRSLYWLFTVTVDTHLHTTQTPNIPQHDATRHNTTQPTAPHRTIPRDEAQSCRSLSLCATLNPYLGTELSGPYLHDHPSRTGTDQSSRPSQKAPVSKLNPCAEVPSVDLVFRRYISSESDTLSSSFPNTARVRRQRAASRNPHRM